MLARCCNLRFQIGVSHEHLPTEEIKVPEKILEQGNTPRERLLSQTTGPNGKRADTQQRESDPEDILPPSFEKSLEKAVQHRTYFWPGNVGIS